MDSAKVVEGDIRRNSGLEIVQCFAESISQANEAPDYPVNREIFVLDVGVGDVALSGGIRLALRSRYHLPTCVEVPGGGHFPSRIACYAPARQLVLWDLSPIIPARAVLHLGVELFDVPLRWLLLLQRQEKLVSRQKSSWLSRGVRLVIADHSPEPVLETGLLMRASEKNLLQREQSRSSVISLVRFVEQMSRNLVLVEVRQTGMRGA